MASLIQPYVSVVVPTLNRDKPLRDTLRYFLERETYPRFELIVIDQSDSHTPETKAFLERQASRMRYVKANYKGLPRARNHGARLAQGDIVLFVDDDVLPQAGFVWAHAAPYSDSRVVGVTGPTLHPGQSLRVPEDMPAVELARIHAQEAVAFDAGFPYEAQWARGCNMSFRTPITRELGFDETFGLTAVGEDAEFSHRARRHGVIRYEPSAGLVHLEAGSGGTRDADGRREYMRRVAFTTNYFHFKVDTPPVRRYRMMWRAYRRHVLTRGSLRSGAFVASSIGFGIGLAESTFYIRRLRAGAETWRHRPNI